MATKKKATTTGKARGAAQTATEEVGNGGEPPPAWPAATAP